MEGLRRSEIRTNSQSSEDSSAFVESEETANLDSMDREWTDEKHSLYLKSMEAAFVSQLHNSMNLLGWQSQKVKQMDPKLPRQLHCTTCTSSGEFKVFRGGCWKKINYGIGEPQNQFSANPWIQHFRTACNHQVVVHETVKNSAASRSRKIELSGKVISCGLASSSNQFHVCHSHSRDQNFVDNKTVAEVSDQNFVGEDIEGEKDNSLYGAKRMKTLINDASSNDHFQVVPFTNSPETEDASGNCERTHTSSG